MTIAATLTALKARLATLQPPTKPKQIWADPRAAVTLGEFPCIVLSLSPQAEHAWSAAAMGLGRHDYTIACWVFVGKGDTPLSELHSRVLAWPQPIADALAADVTLGGAVGSIGYPSDDRLFTYRIGPIAWADGNYWGLALQIPVFEKIPQVMG